MDVSTWDEAVSDDDAAECLGNGHPKSKRPPAHDSFPGSGGGPGAGSAPGANGPPTTGPELA